MEGSGSDSSNSDDEADVKKGDKVEEDDLNDDDVSEKLVKQIADSINSYSISKASEQEEPVQASKKENQPTAAKGKTGSADGIDDEISSFSDSSAA